MQGDIVSDAGERVARLIDNGKLRVVFQPLIGMNSGKVYAYEALVRVDSDDYLSPPDLFSQAIQGKMCGRLGRAIRALAIESCPSWPLFLNIHPAEFDEHWLVQPNDPIFMHREMIHLEITESVPLTHYRHCHRVLGEVRGKGVLLAVDDLGAGYSNLRYIADLRPEVVKLDRELVKGLNDNGRMHSLVSSIVRLCRDLGAKVVAEGIETAEEMEAVRRTGADYGQGYFLARPGYPLPRLRREAVNVFRAWLNAN